MADPQPINRFAWIVDIDGPATIRGATVDLAEALAVSTLGSPYRGRIVNTPIVQDGLPNLFYGVRRRAGTELVLDNRDGAIDPTEDWRLSPVTLRHFDRESGAIRTELTGIIGEQRATVGRMTFVVEAVDAGILRDLLPAATINPVSGGPFDDSASPGAPIPMVFGSDVLVRLPSLNIDNASAGGEVSSSDYGVGYGDLTVSAVFGELDTARPGLEVLGSWAAVAGSPAYLSGEPVTAIRETQFSVTGDQRHRYLAGMPIRFKTTTSGSTFRHSVVTEYRTDTDPHRVAIFHPLIDSGLNTVQVVGDYQIITDVYDTVTTGLLPVPAAEQEITAVRVFGDIDGGLIALTSNSAYPSGSGGASPVDIIGEVITNPAWGLSARAQQSLNATSFTLARIRTAFSGLLGTIQGALAYDGQRRPAEEILDALLLIARARLGRDAVGHWTCDVDYLSTSMATFCHGPGTEEGPRIKSILHHRRVALSEAVRNVVLHWSPLGRANRRNIREADYARTSTKAVAGVGRDRHFFNPFIRSEDAAGWTLQYLAEMLKGADEELACIVGVEARDRLPGDVITVADTLGGASGDWIITRTAKTLGGAELGCIRYRADAYIAPTGIVHSAEPGEAANTRTEPGLGPNFVPNPEPAPPTRLSDRSPGFAPPYMPYVDGVPHGWTLGHIPGHTVVEELALDKSAAVAEQSVSGHYCRIKFSALAPAGSFARSDACEGFVSDVMVIRQGADHILSFYGDQPEGWYVNLTESDAPTFTQRLLTLIRDETDTDQNGWARLYARFRPMPTTTHVRLSIGVSTTDAYQWAGVMVEPVTGSARKPSAWRRTATAPATLSRSTSVSFNGASEYLLSGLILAGDYVHGATTRIQEAIVFAWGEAPGSPEYLTTELDAHTRATQFAVTGHQAAAYAAGTPIRYKTTSTFVVDPDSYATSTVVAYHAGVGGAPDRVEIADDNIDAGLNTVELQGTEWEVGTEQDPTAWGDRLRLTAVDEKTTSRNYRGGSGHTFAPVDQFVRVAARSGALADGVLNVTLHYTRSAPTVGA